SAQLAGEPTLTCGQADYTSAPNRQPGEDFNGSIALVPSPLPTGTNACIDLIIRALRENNKSRVLLFVHGYNNTFHFAVSRAIASAIDVEFDGLVLVWSWPSEGNARTYM